MLIYINISVRYVKKSEETYYDILLKYSETHLMLYPYHLSNIVVRELRLTPFSYYINIMTVIFYKNNFLCIFTMSSTLFFVD